jgi:hypothetical protein
LQMHPQHHILDEAAHLALQQKLACGLQMHPHVLLLFQQS